MEVGHCSERRHLFYRLMGRAVFSHTDAVMCEYVSKRCPHQCGKTGHRLTVITKHKECGHICPESPMEHDAVADCSHGKLPDAKVQIAAASVFFRKITCARHRRLIRRSQVSRPSEQIRHDILQIVNDSAGNRTRCLCFFLPFPELPVLIQHFCGMNVIIPVPEFFHLGIFFTVCGKHHVPGRFCLCFLLRDGSKMFIYLIRHIERFLVWPFQSFPERFYILRAKRLSVRAGFALFRRTAVSNLRLNRDK